MCGESVLIRMDNFKQHRFVDIILLSVVVMFRTQEHLDNRESCLTHLLSRCGELRAVCPV